MLGKMHLFSTLKGVLNHSTIKTAFAAVLLSGLALAGSCGCGRQAGGGEGERAGSAVPAGREPDGETESRAADHLINSEGAVILRGRQLTIGFSQIGAESDWRLASSASMENTFSIDNGYNLIFDNAQQKQENQIKAIREFIDQGVDYIILDPIVETGWTSSLREAKEAGIPVIVVDREVRLEDESLYTAWLGSDFRLEGDRACAWLKEFLAGQEAEATGSVEQADPEGPEVSVDPDASGDPETTEKPYKMDEPDEAARPDEPVGILHIQGTLNSSAQIGRSQALFEAARENGWEILQSVSGDFVQAKGKEVAEAALKEFGDKISVIYCENDNMAYGVIEAIEEAGRKAGTDIGSGEILIISFDSAQDGLEYTLDGRIAVDTECNPLYGPALSRLILDLETGEKTEKKNYYEEEQFSAYAPISSLEVDGTRYPVTMITEEMIRGRSY